MPNCDLSSLTHIIQVNPPFVSVTNPVELDVNADRQSFELYSLLQILKVFYLLPSDLTSLITRKQSGFGTGVRLECRDREAANISEYAERG